MKFHSQRSAIGRRAATGTVLALTAATFSLGVAGPAQAANTIELEGTVTGTGGVPLEGIRVQAFDATTAQPLLNVTASDWASAVTDAAGHYEFDDLGTASVKLRLYDETVLTMTSPLPYTPRWVAGPDNFSGAATVAVTEDPATAATAPTTSLTEHYGALTGTLTADGRPASDPNLGAYVSVMNADDDWAGGGFATSGTSYRTLAAPGQVRASAEASDWQTDPADPVYFIRKWWQNTYSQANATVISVHSGQTVTGIDFSLTKTLAATSAPQVVGYPTVGRPLSAAPGTWSQSSNTQYGYTWLRGTTVVGTGPSYVPTVADFGSRLTLRVTADADKYDWYHNSGQATVTSAVVRHPATPRVRAHARDGRKVALAIKMVAAKQSPVRGKVVVFRGAKRVHVAVRLVRGKAFIMLRHQPKGRHAYTVHYKGNKVLAQVDKTVTVRVHS
jgi:hypothetical protein